ncbi:glutamate 5-kinase [Aliikangiella marina]|uniref:Glutamate 5-kinase n=1 Tax=Aliikangiella marina TaxID=1712262 RepID=A0A545THS7_9GAMM|nr:glutamate 5-kinase [Aliikangiella marina]TQV76711.1 glutamate 5-kinase [Aliikangiella marina]
MQDFCHFQKVVIKVGSALIAPEGRGSSVRYLLSLADFVHHCLQQGKDVVIVSSGSVAAGSGLTNHHLAQKLSIPQKQALASIGQTHLMQHWQKLFDNHCAQILLTRSDLESLQRRANAKNTINTLLSMQAIPIINENDSVVVDELVVGDNDNLAAQVAEMCNADLLIICSDVEGLFDKNPKTHDKAQLIPLVEKIEDSHFAIAGATDNPIATGGMQTKLQAAKFASDAGIDTLIVNGRNVETFERLKRNQTTGTWFKSQINKESHNG